MRCQPILRWPSPSDENEVPADSAVQEAVLFDEMEIIQL